MSRASKRITRIDPAFVIVDKSAGMTSHDVVARIRRIYNERRVGHSGTLDPDATGVLVVGIGAANRLFSRFEDCKQYEATIRFGATTTTLDASGDVLEQFDMNVDADDLLSVLPRFIGDVEQIPPMVSAVHVDGKRLHQLAREGKEVERQPRPVRIDSIVVTAVRSGPNSEADLVVDCGGGTYIRSLAADIGTALGGGAHLSTLRRTRVGPFTGGHAHTLAEIEADPAAASIPIAAAFGWPATNLSTDDTLTKQVRNGVRIPASSVPGWVPGLPNVVSIEGRVAAVYENIDDEWRPVVGVPQLQD